MIQRHLNLKHLGSVIKFNVVCQRNGMQCLDLHGTTNYSEFLPSISDCKDVSFNAQFRRYHIYNPR